MRQVDDLQLTGPVGDGGAQDRGRHRGLHLAFEAGEVSQDRFGKRVRELEDKASALAARRADLSAAQRRPSTASTSAARALGRIAGDLRSAADNAPDQLRKSVVQAFVDGLLVVAGAR